MVISTKFTFGSISRKSYGRFQVKNTLHLPEPEQLGSTKICVTPGMVSSSFICNTSLWYVLTQVVPYCFISIFSVSKRFLSFSTAWISLQDQNVNYMFYFRLGLWHTQCCRCEPQGERFSFQEQHTYPG
jgi:hypothetical protein